MKMLNTLIAIIALMMITSCKTTKPAVEYSTALQKNANIKKTDLRKYQFFLGPDGFDLYKDIDSTWTKPGTNGKMVIIHKEGTNRIEAKPFMKVSYKSTEVIDGKIKYKVDFGPVTNQSGKVFYKSTILYFTPDKDADGVYVLDMPPNGTVKLGKDIFIITFTGDTPKLYVDASTLEKKADMLLFKGNKVKN